MSRFVGEVHTGRYSSDSATRLATLTDMLGDMELRVQVQMEEMQAQSKKNGKTLAAPEVLDELRQHRLHELVNKELSPSERQLLVESGALPPLSKGHKLPRLGGDERKAFAVQAAADIWAAVKAEHPDESMEMRDRYARDMARRELPDYEREVAGVEFINLKEDEKKAVQEGFRQKREGVSIAAEYNGKAADTRTEKGAPSRKRAQDRSSQATPPSAADQWNDPKSAIGVFNPINDYKAESLTNPTRIAMNKPTVFNPGGFR